MNPPLFLYSSFVTQTILRSSFDKPSFGLLRTLAVLLFDCLLLLLMLLLLCVFDRRVVLSTLCRVIRIVER